MVTSSFLRSVWYRTSPANSIYTVHLVNHTCTGRQISTLPQNVVPSMLTSLTSLFGMVRGVLLVAWLPSFMLLHEVNVLNGRALFYHSQRNELCLDFRSCYCIAETGGIELYNVFKVSKLWSWIRIICTYRDVNFAFFRVATFKSTTIIR